MPRVRTTLASDSDDRRRNATAELDPEGRGTLGQFFTPTALARLMAGMFGELKEDIRLLDAGAGIGGLTEAFVQELCTRKPARNSVTTTAFEVDSVLVPHLRETHRRCQAICKEHQILFHADLEHTDFLEAAIRQIEEPLLPMPRKQFNAAIMNPPYRKIRNGSREQLTVRRIGVDVTNLYAAFVSMAIALLEPQGQLVAIIPRSFCNGPYFRSFRNFLLRETSFVRIHLFHSRKDAFRDDDVLQENVIVHLRKDTKSPSTLIVSSSSRGDSAIATREIGYSEVIRKTENDAFIHLPTDENDDRVAKWVRSLPDTLSSLGITVSTGKVVDFRARQFLRQDPEESNTAPLIFPCHLANGRIRWPIENATKPNAIVRCSDTQNLLVPRGYYVLTKRFSSKEERRRLVASVYDPELVPSAEVGFENHLNFFHRKGEGLDKNEAFGLCAFLNSTPVDTYFRQFNGHTQVNATDLRSLRYPSHESLCDLGREKLRLGPNQPQDAVLDLYPLQPTSNVLDLHEQTG